MSLPSYCLHIYAADILSDEGSRALYDRYGLEGMGRHGDLGGGKGNARKAWDEFKPHKRENKRTRARGAAAAAFPGPVAAAEGLEGPGPAAAVDDRCGAS